MNPSHPEIRTRCAHWGWSEHQYMGEAIYDWCGRGSLMDLTVLATSGKRLPVDCIALLNDAAFALSMADPRIWPLKLTRVVASFGGTLAAHAAGMSIMEDARIGPWGACGKAAEELLGLRQAIQDRTDDSQWVEQIVDERLNTRSFLWGFGVPFRGQDERLVTLTRCVEQRGRADLPHWRTQVAVSAAMFRLRKVPPNVGLGMAAACLDMGLTEREISALATALLEHAFLSNALEGARQAPETLRELPMEHLRYVGVGPRESPRARQR